MQQQKLELSPLTNAINSLQDALATVAHEAWFKYRLMRNLTSHTYNHDKAQQVYEGTLDFIKDAQTLLEKLEARNA